MFTKKCAIPITCRVQRLLRLAIWSNHITTDHGKKSLRCKSVDIRVPGSTVLLLNISHWTQNVHSPVFNVTLQQFLMITFYWIWQRIETLFRMAGFWKERNFYSIHQIEDFPEFEPPVKSIYYVFRSSQNRIPTIRPTHRPPHTAVLYKPNARPNDSTRAQSGGSAQSLLDLALNSQDAYVTNPALT